MKLLASLLVAEEAGQPEQLDPRVFQICDETPVLGMLLLASNVSVERFGQLLDDGPDLALQRSVLAGRVHDFTFDFFATGLTSPNHLGPDTCCFEIAQAAALSEW